MNLDITVNNCGGLFQFVIESEAGRQWVEENVALEPWQWLGPDSFVVDHRYAGEVADGMMADGMVVR